MTWEFDENEWKVKGRLNQVTLKWTFDQEEYGTKGIRDCCKGKCFEVNSRKCS